MTCLGSINIEERVKKGINVTTSSKNLIKVSLMTGDMKVDIGHDMTSRREVKQKEWTPSLKNVTTQW